MPIPNIEDITVKLTDPIPDDPPDLIPGLMPLKGQMVLAGETNVGKSLMALEICSCLSTGQPLWGELAPVQQAKRILYVLGEHHPGVIQRLAQLTQLPFSDEVLLLGTDELGWDKHLVQGGKPNVTAISKFTKWTEGCDLVVWDPLAAFVMGSEAENDNVQMRLVLDVMNYVCQQNGASCLVLAHQGKPMMDKFGVEHGRKSYAIRGASAIEDAATNIFYLGQARGESDAAKKATDNQIFALTCRKYKGEAPNEYRLLRDGGTLTHTLLGGRPFVDVQRYAMQGAFARLKLSVPGLADTDAIKCLAAMKDCSDITIRRYLGLA